MGQRRSDKNIRNEIKQLQEELKLLKNLMPEKSYLESAEEVDGTQPKLYGNHPNPFSRFTTVKYFVPDGSHKRVSLFIVDEKGNQKMFLDGLKDGKQKLIIKDHALDPGVYLCSLVVDGNIIETCKMRVEQAPH